VSVTVRNLSSDRAILDAVKQRLNEMAARVLAPYYRLRQDDGTFPEVSFDVQHPDGSGSLNLHVNVRTDTHTALAREIAAASHVLLKNANSTASSATNGKRLPISSSFAGSVAIIGQDAAMPKDGCSLNKCNEGVMVIGWGSGSYSLEHVVPPVTSITEKVTASGGTVATSLSNDINQAVAAAKGKDIAFVFANAMSGELGFYDVVEGNMGDRNDLALWWKGGSMVSYSTGTGYCYRG
jgi:beta-glucosidase